MAGHQQAGLPAGGYATPSAYMAGGRHFAVIACGGGNGLAGPWGPDE